MTDSAADLFESVVERRFLIAILGVVLCMWLGDYGWNHYYTKRRWLGILLLIAAFLSALFGLFLLYFSAFSWSWYWFL